MLKLISDETVVLNVDDFYICEKASGLDELIFTMSIHDENYPHVLEEAIVEYEQPYLIKAIDAGSDTAKVKCQINLDALKATLTVGYSNNSATLAATVDGVLPSGWLFIDNSGSTISRTIEGNYTPLEVIQQCVDTYDVVFRFDVTAKIIRAYTLSAFQPLGAFATRELNLTEVNFKGKSTDFYTRLYAYGKDGLSFADINDGKPYVDCNDYSDKVICAYWQDDRYTVAANLLAAAQSAVDEAGVPSRSYECTVYDLAKTNPDMYGFQDFSLFSVVKLIDDIKGISLNYQVVEYWRYPNYPENNVVTLSSTAPKIQNTVKNIQTQIENPNSSFRQNMQALIDAMAASIAGYDGGNMVITQNTDGQPNGIMIMDTADQSTATKVLWFNLNGITYSANGVNGPYEAVWSFEEGGFVADWIIAGTMIADRIKGGTLTLGGENDVDGVCTVLDADGNVIVQLDESGITSSSAKITGGQIDISGLSKGFPAIRLGDEAIQFEVEITANRVAVIDKTNKIYGMVSAGSVGAGTMTGTSLDEGYAPKAGFTYTGGMTSQYAYNNPDSSSPNVVIWANGLFLRSSSSSRRYKTDISEEFPEEINPEKLYQIPVKSFKYKEGYLREEDVRNEKDIPGFIAEEVEEVYPIAVQYDENGEPEMWNANIMIPAMLKLIQEQNERIRKLEEALK